MCKHRIFSRTKSNRPDATYIRRDKVFLGVSLQQILENVRNRRNRMGPEVEIERFIEDGQDLLDGLTKLEICQKDVVGHVKNVLCAAHRLNKGTDFDKLFEGVNPTELDPLLRKCFIDRLSKLAQYRECALYLLQVAKDLNIFRKTEVTLVSLSEKLLATNFKVSPGRHLNDCLSRCGNGASLAHGVRNIASKLKDLKLDNSTFLSTVGNVLQDSRVHAEVQIVCHYELHPAAKMPRVICSSKDACYLCNLFVQLHGKFYIPRTHGNVYTSWLLPPVPSLTNVQARLNKALEVEIGGIIGNLMKSDAPKLVLTQNQNESTVFPFSTFLPTPESSVAPAEASGNGDQATETHGIHGAQQCLREIGEGLTRGLSIEAPPQTPTTGTFGPASPVLESHTSRPLGGDAGLPITPQASVPNSPKVPEVKDVDSANFHEGARKDPDELATASPDHPALANRDTVEPYQETKPAQEPKPTLDPKSKTETTSPISSLPPQIHHHRHLARDQPITLSLSPTATGTALTSFTAGPITIHPDLIRTTQPPTNPLITEVHIHWLPRRRAAAFYLARPKGFVDLEMCEAGVNVEGESAAGCLYVAYRGEVVVFDFGRGMVLGVEGGGGLVVLMGRVVVTGRGGRGCSFSSSAVLSHVLLFLSPFLSFFCFYLVSSSSSVF